MAKSFGTLPATAQAIKPFTVSVPEEELDAFKTLLRHSKVATPTYESLQEDRRYGVTSAWMVNAKDHWLNKFDWRASEKYINSFPNFVSRIEDKGEMYDVHFVALFSKKSDAIPVISLHGWPGSFLEFIPLMSLASEEYTPHTLPYHLIVPSIPGYAFSSGPPKDTNFDVSNASRILDKLMANLGFGDGYVATGGDIGSSVARILAAQYDSCKAMQTNVCAMREPPASVAEESLSEHDRQLIQRGKTFMATGAAYAMEHGTRTSTIGHVLSSNPLALLAWIGEKYLEWSDEDPSLDTILEAISLYWFTETIPRCLYPYRQNFEGVQYRANTPGLYVKKPFGYSLFPKEISPSPKPWVETTGTLSFFRQHEAGGHFAALERPADMKKDMEEFIQHVIERGVKFSA